MLQISRLSKRFGSLQALNELSFHVGDDELVGFVGANGAGKSTTMRIAMGVLEADSGTVTWDGQPVDAGLRRRIGYMPEERGLYPKMKVEAQLTYLARPGARTSPSLVATTAWGTASRSEAAASRSATTQEPASRWSSSAVRSCPRAQTRLSARCAPG